MNLSENVQRVLILYLRHIDKIVVGARLSQVWDAMDDGQKAAISNIIRPHYSLMFGARSTGKEFAVIADCAEVLTGPQRAQLLNLLKSDLEDFFDAQRAIIDAQSSDITGASF